MKIEQIYTGCLAQGAYYIHSGGEAIIIDPLREVQPYLDRLEKDGVVLKYIFETHFHADFVGHQVLGQFDDLKRTFMGSKIPDNSNLHQISDSRGWDYINQLRTGSFGVGSDNRLFNWDLLRETLIHIITWKNDLSCAFYELRCSFSPTWSLGQVATQLG